MDCIYETETIGDQEILYYRVHKNYFRLSKIVPQAFQSKGDGMSTDWAKYSTEQESYSRCKIPADNAIVSLSTADIRSEKLLDAIHKPEDNNQSHSLVVGIPTNEPFKTEVRLHLMKIHKEVIHLINQ